MRGMQAKVLKYQKDDAAGKIATCAAGLVQAWCKGAAACRLRLVKLHRPGWLRNIWCWRLTQIAFLSPSNFTVKTYSALPRKENVQIMLIFGLRGLFLQSTRRMILRHWIYIQKWSSLQRSGQETKWIRRRHRQRKQIPDKQWREKKSKTHTSKPLSQRRGSPEKQGTEIHTQPVMVPWSNRPMKRDQ